MAEVFEVKVDSKKLDEAIAKVPDRLFRTMSQELLREMRSFETDLVTNHLSGKPLATRSGDLRRSWKNVVLGDRLDNLIGRVFSTSKYAATHEYGDPNRVPRNAKMLSIPLDAAKFPSGASRYNSPLRETLKGEFSHTWVQRGPSGQLILFGQRGETGGAIPLFALVPRVSIPARMGARQLFRQRLPGVAQALGRAAARALGEVGVGG